MSYCAWPGCGWASCGRNPCPNPPRRPASCSSAWLGLGTAPWFLPTSCMMAGLLRRSRRARLSRGGVDPGTAGGVPRGAAGGACWGEGAVCGRGACGGGGREEDGPVDWWLTWRSDSCWSGPAKQIILSIQVLGYVMSNFERLLCGNSTGGISTRCARLSPRELQDMRPGATRNIQQTTLPH